MKNFNLIYRDNKRTLDYWVIKSARTNLIAQILVHYSNISNVSKQSFLSTDQIELMESSCMLTPTLMVVTKLTALSSSVSIYSRKILEMTGMKMTLKTFNEEFGNMKDIFQREISKLQEIINEQGTNIEMLEKVVAKETSIDSWEKTKVSNSSNVNVRNPEKCIKCKVCDEKVKSLSELELHIQQNHETHEKQECDQCGKTFVTAWRLRKQKKNHLRESITTCKYFKSKKNCPFETFGCKFGHDITSEENSELKDDTNTDDEDIEDLPLDKTCSVSLVSFVTPTPHKRKFKCEECTN